MRAANAASVPLVPPPPLAAWRDKRWVRQALSLLQSPETLTCFDENRIILTRAARNQKVHTREEDWLFYLQ